MPKTLEIQTYEKLFKFNLEMNEKLLTAFDFCNEITGLITKHFNYKNSIIILSEDKFINIYDNVNLKKIYSQEYIDKDIKNEYILNNKHALNISGCPDGNPQTLYLEDIISFVDYEQTDFYNNFFKDRDIFYEAIIFIDESTSSLSLYKSKKDSNFSESERLLITYIAKIIRCGYKVYQKMNKMNADINRLKESYNISSLGNIIINKNKEIVDYNPASVEFCNSITGEINTDRALGHFISALEKATDFTNTAEQNINYYISKFRIEITIFINKTVYETFEKNYLITISNMSLKKDPSAFFLKYNITDREQEIISYISKGFKTQEIADDLCISIHTVKAHIKNIFSKLDVNTQTGIIAKFNENI